MGSWQSVSISSDRGAGDEIGFCRSNLRAYDCSSCHLKRVCNARPDLPKNCACPTHHHRQKWYASALGKQRWRTITRLWELDTRNHSLCAGRRNVVPLLYHSIGLASAPLSVVGNSAKNPRWKLNYHNDSSGLQYVKDMCGADVAMAYQCMAAGQLRADVFRFCAMWSQGGLYLDSDLEATAPFESMYAPCASFSLGLDVNTGKFDNMEQKQMKLLASQSRSLISRCMLDRIVDRVRTRWVPEYPADILNLTGPALLAQCYHHHRNQQPTAVTYEDRRNNKWPHTGLVGFHEGHFAVLAWERPSTFHFVENVDINRTDYTHVSSHRMSLYSADCAL